VGRGQGVSLGDLAQGAGAEVRGDASFVVHAVRVLEQADHEDLSFAFNGAYRSRAHESAAGALLVPPELADLDRPLLVSPEPKRALAHVLARLHPRPRPAPGIHATAVIDADCQIDPSASIGPHVVIGAESKVAADAVLRAHVVVGRDCDIGEQAELHPHVVLYDGSRVGARSILHAGVIVGSDGFG
jgi:UDP-3-O-[3-hydroxymyristoyl] glucosamine N-acyltransferase